MINFNVHQHIAYVTLSRPDKQNALTLMMFQSLDNIIKEIRKNRQIRAVIIQGAGDHFCAGLDVQSVMKHPMQIVKLLFKYLPGNQNLVQRVVLGWRTLPVPVYAEIKGNCLGGGLHIALGADFRIALPNSQFAIMESRWGLCPDMGTSIVVPGYLRQDQALKLAFEAQRVDAKAAFQAGLLTAIDDDPSTFIMQHIDSLSHHSPDALAAIKLLYNQAFHAPSRTLLWRETWYQLRLLASKNTRIAMKNGAKDSEFKAYNNRAKWQ
ncbi:crotonase/enoyl-CoA hydratase family protein [Pseudoalteromonas luteoviolacea]|uniref:crotonase/enoyl-CoA hydratase family protein n=1 Tax=Pseudoalteromonas luteoviolacea TaxID=43657 RepID=UPI00114ECFE9|nr:crotonase/enoyl-CoA hydratase family protein [Pseudoalteromonas luteoviolacea]TQF71644.1 crotonase/enoyl-CoA hydratase family protein [Pseudoalteromonas luteoviolacea]